ncbi:MAG: helix-turn-helix domain-containing protein [Actinomycetaceae bacterium]|nr:helix-turn-helix domain-containing protein [Actinomycetaceae bacterium]
MTHLRWPRHIVIVLPAQAHILDIAGPAQVFSSANDVVNDSGGSLPYRLHYYADTELSPTYQGITVQGSHLWPTLRPQDLVIVPGWKVAQDVALRRQVRPGTPPPDRIPTEGGFSAQQLAHIRKHWESGGHVASICAGSLALAEIGILRGQTVTTHHGLLPYLAAYPKVSVAADVLFTCAPRLHTSAGIASGIDLSLHLVAHDLGPAVAAKVARTLVVPAWRPGNATQHSVMLMHRDHMDDLAHRAQDILDDVEHDPGTLGQIAQRLGVSSRTLSRHFVAATGMTPNAYLSAIRAERATQLHDAGWSWDEAARAVGYANARSLRSRS